MSKLFSKFSFYRVSKIKISSFTSSTTVHTTKPM